jgi:hypothetical protein
MKPGKETLQEELCRLEEELIDMRKTQPEHCYGTQRFIWVHRPTPEHRKLIEDTEDRITELQDAVSYQPLSDS